MSFSAAISSNGPWPIMQDEFDSKAACLRSKLKESMSILWDRMTETKNFSEGDYMRLCSMLKTAFDCTKSLEESQKRTRYALLTCSIRNTYLHLAAACGNSNTVMGLVQANPFQIDAKNYKGVTALHMSIWHGHTTVVNILIDHGSSIYVKAPHGLTPLHLAIVRGKTFICKLLVAKDVESKLLNEPNDQGQSALHLAISRMNEEIVELLILAGAKIHQRDGHGKTCVDLAKESGNHHISEMVDWWAGKTLPECEYNGRSGIKRKRLIAAEAC
tara:strand:- start:3640 stop:4458 length:819 start_codon:yes stop_codon:yes gene_type:complete